MTAPVMNGWIVHVYVYVPGALKVTVELVVAVSAKTAVPGPE